jgi:hypothetical protein
MLELNININQKFREFYSKINIIKSNIINLRNFIYYILVINYGNFIIISFTRSLRYL